MINILHSCLFTVFFFLFRILLVFCFCLLGFVVFPVEKKSVVEPAKFQPMHSSRRAWFVRQIYRALYLFLCFRLKLFQRFDSFRILICGGDGSIGWVLTEIDKLDLHKQVSVMLLEMAGIHVWHWCQHRVTEHHTNCICCIEQYNFLLSYWLHRDRKCVKICCDG